MLLYVIPLLHSTLGSVKVTVSTAVAFQGVPESLSSHFEDPRGPGTEDLGLSLFEDPPIRRGVPTAVLCSFQGVLESLSCLSSRICEALGACEGKERTLPPWKRLGSPGRWPLSKPALAGTAKEAKEAKRLLLHGAESLRVVNSCLFSRTCEVWSGSPSDGFRESLRASPAFRGPASSDQGASKPERSNPGVRHGAQSVEVLHAVTARTIMKPDSARPNCKTASSERRASCGSHATPRTGNHAQATSTAETFGLMAMKPQQIT